MTALEKKDAFKEMQEHFNPRAIKAYLDRFVIGQEKAKRVLSVAAYKHLLRFKAIKNKEKDVPVKSNVVLIGSTGCGKTFLFQKLVEYMQLPFAHVDMSSCTKTGYVGSSIEDFEEKIQYTSKNGNLGNYAVVMLDEIDKIADKSDKHDFVATQGVQYELLRVLEGRQLKKNKTDNMLFIAAGAFGGVVNEGKQKKKVTAGIKAKSVIEDVPLNDQLVEYGLLPELVGRLQIGACLNDLAVEDLVNIMTACDDSIVRNAINLFKSDGLDLTFDDDALRFIAEVAIKKGTGARALQSMIELVLTDLQFELLGSNSQKKIRITKKVCEGKFSL